MKNYFLFLFKQRVFYLWVVMLTVISIKTEFDMYFYFRNFECEMVLNEINKEYWEEQGMFWKEFELKKKENESDLIKSLIVYSSDERVKDLFKKHPVSESKFLIPTKKLIINSIKELFFFWIPLLVLFNMVIIFFLYIINRLNDLLLIKKTLRYTTLMLFGYVFLVLIS